MSGSTTERTRTILASELRAGYTLVTGSSEREILSVVHGYCHTHVFFADDEAPQNQQFPLNYNVIVVTTADGF